MIKKDIKRNDVLMSLSTVYFSIVKSFYSVDSKSTDNVSSFKQDYCALMNSIIVSVGLYSL